MHLAPVFLANPRFLAHRAPCVCCAPAGTGRAGGDFGSSPEGGDEASQGPKGPRVMVVDDNAINRRVLAGMVRALGCEVVMAGTGQEAIDKMRANSDFQLIFMDCEMPGMDGFEATEKIRAQWGPKVPIVAASAYTAEEDQKRCIASGMNDFMSKPLKRHAVKGVFEKWVPDAFAMDATGS